jgi:hypothetical protein
MRLASGISRIGGDEDWVEAGVALQEIRSVKTVEEKTGGESLSSGRWCWIVGIGNFVSIISISNICIYLYSTYISIYWYKYKDLYDLYLYCYSIYISIFRHRFSTILIIFAKDLFIYFYLYLYFYSTYIFYISILIYVCISLFYFSISISNIIYSYTYVYLYLYFSIDVHVSIYILNIKEPDFLIPSLLEASLPICDRVNQKKLFVLAPNFLDHFREPFHKNSIESLLYTKIFSRAPTKFTLEATLRALPNKHSMYQVWMYREKGWRRNRTRWWLWWCESSKPLCTFTSKFTYYKTI